MATKPLTPNDPRVDSKTAQVRGKTYKYIVGQPQRAEPLGTIFLIHGFPDLGFGWRYQVPHFMSLGFRVVVPDMIGYGGTDAPEDLQHYTQKSIAADIKDLASQVVPGQQIIVGGHDWGGATAWRTALWHPELVRAVFTVCTPYNAPHKTRISLEQIVNGPLPNFRYQLQFVGPELERHIRGEEKVRQFLVALFGGAGPGGEHGFSTRDGVLFDNLPLLRPSRILQGEDLDFYTREYLRHEPELRGKLNWYRVRDLDFEAELELVERGATRLEMPALFVAAKKDAALPPAMSEGMEKHIDHLSRGEVNASHWALTQAPTEVNACVGEWLTSKAVAGATKASL